MFTIYSEGDTGFTLVPNTFIDEYMRDANDAQLKIYLYLLRTMSCGGSACISDIADQFNHTEREVLRSLRYWEKRRVLTLEYSDNGEVTGIQLKKLQPAENANMRADSRNAAEPPDNFTSDAAVQNREHAAGGVHSGMQTSDLYTGNALQDRKTQDRGIQGLTLPSHREENISSDVLHPTPSSGREAVSVTAPPQHRPDEAQLEEFRGNRKRAQLLFVIEQYIGKPLSPGEVQSVCYISEELHFSDALIDYLLQYCIDRGKKDFRYIEKVAVNWAENGITTPRQAERAVSPARRKKRGQSGSRPSVNKFNQFEQNHYDFDELEREILGS